MSARTSGANDDTKTVLVVQRRFFSRIFRSFQRITFPERDYLSSSSLRNPHFRFLYRSSESLRIEFVIVFIHNGTKYTRFE